MRISDWSSDVCSSDLVIERLLVGVGVEDSAAVSLVGAIGTAVGNEDGLVEVWIVQRVAVVAEPLERRVEAGFVVGVAAGDVCGLAACAQDKGLRRLQLGGVDRAVDDDVEGRRALDRKSTRLNSSH